MNESPTAKAAFAPAWPSLYSTSYSADSEVVPSYCRTKVFNHDLTIDQLEPLLEDCPIPGRTLRRVGGIAFLSAYAMTGISYLSALVIVRLHVPGDFPTYEEMDAGLQVLGLVSFAAAAIWFTGFVLDFVARKTWVAAVTSAWQFFDGHLVRTRDLPEDRQQSVNSLGRRLDGALKALDANDPAAKLLDLAALAAIGRYFELPVTSGDARRIAQSEVVDPTVQQVRDTYESATAAEKASLQAAKDAVGAVEDYVVKVKAAAADQEIIELAKTIDRSRS